MFAFAFALALAFAPIPISAIAHAGERSDALVAKTLGVSGVTHAKSSSHYSKNFSDIDYESVAGKTLKAICARGATAAAGVTPNDPLGEPKIKTERLTVLVKAAL